MEYSTPIRILIEDFLQNRDLLMCTVYQERSGTTLLKLRFDNSNGGQTEPGEGTHNLNAYFRRKNQKQIDRDLNRVHVHSSAAINGIHTRSKGPTKDQVNPELPRSDSATDGQATIDILSGVGSP